MNEKKPLIVLVGKPNVGKSTLFNTLIGRAEAIVGEEYGLTRDYQKVICFIEGTSFFLIDTAGLIEDKNIYGKELLRFTSEQINLADILLFVLDSSKDITKDDIYCSQVLRKTGKKVILLENKAELRSASNFGNQGYSLGHGIPLQITAKNKNGIHNLTNEIKKCIKTNTIKTSDNDLNNEAHIRISIAGRPNTGKSTLFNMIYNNQRVITGEVSGTTRDSIISEIEYKKKRITIIDTAGIKKRGKIDNSIDKAATYYSRKEIRYSNIVILVFDATTPFSNQDLNIANYIIKEGRAIMLIINKWDLVENKSKIKKDILDSLDKRLFDVKGVNCLFLSALNKEYKEDILENILRVYEVWNKKINTSALNNWLRKDFLDRRSEDFRGALKIKYITQTKIRPPTFSIFCNNKAKLNNTVKRKLENKIRKKFGLFGIPLRFNLLSSKNPFNKK